jgi:hypothetical protein
MPNNGVYLNSQIILAGEINLVINKHPVVLALQRFSISPETGGNRYGVRISFNHRVILDGFLLQKKYCKAGTICNENRKIWPEHRRPAVKPRKKPRPASIEKTTNF